MRGVVVDLRFREADHLETSRPQIEIASSIILKCDAASVEGEAVRFDDELPIAPEKVDEVRADRDVDLRERQAVTPAEPQEVSLEVASRVIALHIANRQAKHLRLPSRPSQLTRRDQTGLVGL